MTDPYRYDGKRALVVGGATGMGAAAARRVADLGGEVIVMDLAPVDHPVARAVKVDLRDPAAIDGALGELDGPIDALFAAAGVADGPELMRVNFIGHRHIIDALLRDGLLTRGSAVCLISSVAGIGWESNLPAILDLLATEDSGSAADWVDAHEGTDNYGFSKQVINTYVARQSYPLMAKGIRINAICPGPTDTPLARANADLWLAFAQDYRDAAGLEVHAPEQMGNAMAFLNSGAADGISGVTLLVDSGHMMSSASGSWEAGKGLYDLFMGRLSTG
ncbi:SDR family oxidoreductase [Actinomadura rugatobispora]|uniref:SDR family oxidoreductase n=1 Tax=Actinomadura rugatobispora TaxID=1994 RepID=A0ABW1A4G2_9ACTN|nr:coniferyl-alcohol dehydrogenase [Actinomadura rugatobispora]